jgi:hypothetical protein
VQKRIGRPPKDAASKKSAHLSIRISERLRRLLEDERRQPEGELSLSQLIEDRLLESFEIDKTFDELFGGRNTRLILQILAQRIASIEISTQSSWLDDVYTHSQIRALIGVVLDHLRPVGRRTIPKSMRWHTSLKKDVQNLGRHNALLALAAIESARDYPSQSDVPRKYRKAARHLGSRLQGSPIEELQNDRGQTRRRIWEYHDRHPEAASKHRKVNAREARAAEVKALVSLLTPDFVKNGGQVNKRQLVKSLKERGVDDKIARAVVKALGKSGTIKAAGEAK